MYSNTAFLSGAGSLPLVLRFYCRFPVVRAFLPLRLHRTPPQLETLRLRGWQRPASVIFCRDHQYLGTEVPLFSFVIFFSPPLWTTLRESVVSGFNSQNTFISILDTGEAALRLPVNIHTPVSSGRHEITLVVYYALRVSTKASVLKNERDIYRVDYIQNTNVNDGDKL